MDAKLGAFWSDLKSLGVLDDTVVIITSDHGEAFGEHGLYLHDASVYDTHLHVPLWIHWPGVKPRRVDDVVSLSALFDLMTAAPTGAFRNTILGEGCRKARPFALAEHFHYPHGPILPRFQRNQRAVIVRGRKVLRAGTEVTGFDTESDAAENRPLELTENDVRSFLQPAVPNGWPVTIVESHLLAREAA